MIKTKGTDPMFWPKLHVILNILINSELFCMELSHDGSFLWDDQNSNSKIVTLCFNQNCTLSWPKCAGWYCALLEVYIWGGWADPPNPILWDTVNERELRILLECILFYFRLLFVPLLSDLGENCKFSSWTALLELFCTLVMRTVSAVGIYEPILNKSWLADHEGAL